MTSNTLNVKTGVRSQISLSNHSKQMHQKAKKSFTFDLICAEDGSRSLTRNCPQNLQICSKFTFVLNSKKKFFIC